MAKKDTKKQKKKKHGFRNFITCLLCIVALIFSAYSIIAVRYIGMMHKSESNSYSVSGTQPIYNEGVRNILLVGTDGRSTGENSRSDTMILMSINDNNHTVTLTSIMRDIYVPIAGHGSDKLNSAYAYGGQDLLIDTIRQNFRIDVDECITVNFRSFAFFADALGGIDMQISDAEADAINVILQSEVNNIMGDDVNSDLLSGGGMVHLNGKQALSYSRIRYVGNADFERTQRQRNVIEALTQKAKTLNPIVFDEYMQKALPELSTNIRSVDLYLLSLKAPLLLTYDMKQYRIPAEGTWNYATINGSSIISVDLEANISALQRDVFNN